ncbi:MAG: zf-HC2 domain-containing protein [Acidimicrobiia bacterium]|nr:zf-HC2 domain-containing protein [Acidimicrobiia bacterium]
MTHPSEMISGYLDGELSGAERAQLLDHLSSCGKCAKELEETQQVRAMVRSLPVLELPVGLVPEADPVIVPLRRNTGFLVGAAAAVVALVIAAAALFAPQPQTVSVDDLSSRFGARVSLDPAFGPAKVVPPEFEEVGR